MSDLPAESPVLTRPVPRTETPVSSSSPPGACGRAEAARPAWWPVSGASLSVHVPQAGVREFIDLLHPPPSSLSPSPSHRAGAAVLEETGVLVQGTGRMCAGDSAGKSDTNHDTDHTFISSG